MEGDCYYLWEFLSVSEEGREGGRKEGVEGEGEGDGQVGRRR